MYQVILDNNILHDPQLAQQGYIVVDSKVTLEANTSGSFVFTIYPTNPMYNSIKRLTSIIEVYDDGELIFRGRPLDDTANINNGQKIICEGELGYFNDSVLSPYSFPLVTGGSDVKDYLQMIIDSHNTQVDETKRFTLGKVTVVDPNGFITRSNIEFTKSWEEIKTKLIDSLGGYLMVRREGDINYIDYLYDSTTRSGQVVELTKNILDYQQAISANDIATVLVPLGAKLKDEEGNETDERLTIESVNGGKEYIEHATGIAKYGRIKGIQIWDDVTTPSALLSKGTSSLNALVNLGISIKIKLIDLNMVDKTVPKLRYFDYVRVISKPHNVDEDMLIKKQTINLDEPEQNTIEVGVDISSFTDRQISTDRAVKIIKADYVTNQKLTNVAQPLRIKMSEIAQDAEQIKLSVLDLEEGVQEANSAISIHSDSINQLSYYSNMHSGQINQVSQTLNGALGSIESLVEVTNTHTGDITTISQELNGGLATLEQKITVNTTDIVEVTQTLNGAVGMIEQKVDKNGVVAAINLSVDKINQARVDITGLVTISSLKTAGQTVINGSNITTGAINANLITTGSLNASLITTGTLSASRISGGTINGTNVTITNLNASNITSGTLSASRINFDGAKGNNVELTGKITATSGKIGGFNISGNNLNSTDVQISPSAIVISGASMMSTNSSGRLGLGGSLVVGWGKSGVRFIQFGNESGGVMPFAGNTNEGTTLNNVNMVQPNSSTTAVSKYVGGSSNRYDYIYLVNAPSVSSDERLKHSIEDIGCAEDFVMSIQAKRFIKQNNQLDFGFIAQQVDEVNMKLGINNASYHFKTENEDEYQSLSYESFIAPLYAVVQQMNKRLNALESRI